MKLKLIAVFLLLISLNAFSLTANMSQNAYGKGESIAIFGSCKGDVSLTAVSEGKKIFSEKASCVGTKYDFEYKIAFSDPSGLWNLNVSDSEDTINKAFNVSHVRESQFFLFKFLSPSMTSKDKGDTIEISIKATDAGENVEEASLYYWNPAGEKKNFEYTGDGVYSAKEMLPVDLNAKSWLIFVTGEGMFKDVLSGGEVSIEVPIAEPDIQIEFLEPLVTNVETEEELLVKVKVVYSNGVELMSPFISLEFNGETFEMTEESPSTFFVILDVKELSDASYNLNVVAVDKSSELAQSQSKIIVLRKGVISLIKRNFPIVLLIIAVIIALLAFNYFVLGKAKSINNLKSEKQKTEKDIKDLQEKFFNKGEYDFEEYKRKFAALERKLYELNKKLKN